MSKTATRWIKEKTAEVRSKLLFQYRDKVFNLWLSSWEWEGLDRDRREYVMRKLWKDGSVAAFSIVQPSKDFLGVPLVDEGLIGFAPYVAQAFNMYNAPSLINLINERGVPYIPARPMVVGRDAVIGYAQHSRAAIEAVVAPTIERIVDVEMTIRTNLIAAKSPYLYEFTPDSEMQASDFIGNLMNDIPVLGVSVSQADALRPSPGGSNYIVDRLYNYKVALENEIHTFLGIDNLGMVEKKEHLLDDEIDSNQAVVDDFSDSIGGCLEEFCDMIRKTLGFEIRVKPKSSPASAVEEKGKKEEDGEERLESEGDDAREDD